MAQEHHETGKGAQMSDNSQIIATGSAYKESLRCKRARWHGYEAPNGQDGPIRGWQRRKLSLAPTTGSWCHQVAQGLLEGKDASEVILSARRGYLDEVASRTVDVEVADSGQWTIDEQAALIEAFGWAFKRVRLPKLLELYEPIAIEHERLTHLSGDVALASREDAVLRRRSDGFLFIYNLKTVSNPDDRWEAQWLVDQQLMTETLAVERELGERVWGVLIDGFVKGPRVKCGDDLKEIRDSDKPVTRYCQRSRLLYGYKTEANPPVQPAMYDWEGTTRKGWFKFAVWQEQAWGNDPVAYWVNWIPVEAVEACFRTLEPIMRSDRAVESFTRQMIFGERSTRDAREYVNSRTGDAREEALDEYFPQDLHSCVYPGKCTFYAICHEPGVAEDPEGSGLYIPRVANHPIEEGD